ncbi:hypothetical protein Daus18300_007365 [Diaporthe australafricana]|uniref:Protein kinase domain-containing protein n=1 Tax=Diaporthe australafricana TaxID=127596 RepID=A0ABR3WN62_9PEZI
MSGLYTSVWKMNSATGNSESRPNLAQNLVNGNQERSRAAGPYPLPNSDAVHEAKASADLQATFGDPSQVQDENKFFQGSGDAPKSPGPRNTGPANERTQNFSREELSNIQHSVGVIRERSSIGDSPELFGGSSTHPPPYGGGTVDGSNPRRTGQNLPSRQTRSSLHPDGAEVSAVSEISGYPYTIVEDGGQDLQSKQFDTEREVPAQEGHPRSGSAFVGEKDDDTLGSQHDAHIIRLTRSRLHQERIACACDANKWFIPKATLAEIITVEIASLALRSCVPNSLNEEQRLDLAKQIIGSPTQENPSPKTYQVILALLIKLGKHDLITIFVNHSIDDSELPLVKQKLKELGNSGCMTRWEDEENDNFLRLQWEFIPAFIAKKGKKIPHYELLPGHVLPYVHVDKPVKETEEEDQNLHLTGSFGKVSIYNLHQRQQGLDRYTVDGLNGLIAVKKLLSDDRKAFLEECNVLMRLTPKPTPHLAKLLATYEQPAGRDHKTPEFFLVFECAESNLDRFWKTSPPEKLMKDHGLNRVQLSRWVATQCRGLAQGLKTLHSHTEDKSESPTKANQKVDQPLHGLHGDIKPANILRYTNWKDPESPIKPLHAPLGVIQITDFGLSSYHHTLTAQDINIKIGASAYKPPEAHLIYPVSQSLDIWTMGCLFLDFVTWLLLGDNGRQEFGRRREKSGRDLISDSHPCFFDVREKKGTTQVSKSRAVILWAEKLCETERSQFIHEFVELIIAKMLVIEDKAHLKTDEEGTQTCSRITANDLAHELDGLVTQDDDYYRPKDKPKAPSLKKYNRAENIIVIRQTIDKVRSDAKLRHR